MARKMTVRFEASGMGDFELDFEIVEGFVHRLSPPGGRYALLSDPANLQQGNEISLFHLDGFKNERMPMYCSGLRKSARMCLGMIENLIRHIAAWPSSKIMGSYAGTMLPVLVDEYMDHYTLTGKIVSLVESVD